MNKIILVCLTLVVFVAGCIYAKPPEKSVKEQVEDLFNEQKAQFEKEKLAKEKVLEGAEQKSIGKIQKEQEAAKKQQDAAKKEQDFLNAQKEAFDKDRELSKKFREDTLKRLEVLEKVKENPIELIKKLQEDIKKLQEAFEKAKEKLPIKIDDHKEPEPKKELPKEKTMSAFDKQSQASMYVQKQRSVYELQLASLESGLILLNSRIRFLQKAENGFRFDQKIEKLVKENKDLKENIGYYQGKYGSFLVSDVDTKTFTKREDDIKNRIASLDQQMNNLSVGDDLKAFQHRFLQLQTTKRDMINKLEQVRTETIKAQSVPAEGSVFSSTIIQGFMRDIEKMKALVVKNEEKIAKLKSEKKNGGRDLAHSMEIARLQQLRQNYLLVIGEIRSSLGMPES